MPLLECCSPVRYSAAESLLRQLDRALSCAVFRLVEVSSLDLSNRSPSVHATCVLYRIYFRDGVQHSLRYLLLETIVPIRDTRHVVHMC